MDVQISKDRERLECTYVYVNDASTVKSHFDIKKDIYLGLRDIHYITHIIWE